MNYFSYQNSLDTDRFSDRSSPEVHRPPPRRPFDDNDDDLDAMITDLKQKTSGRDMYKIVSDIEGVGGESSSGRPRVYGRKSVSPIPRRDFYNDPEPTRPQTRPPMQHQPPPPPMASYDPYENIRGGTGYSFQFERRQPHNVRFSL